VTAVSAQTTPRMTVAEPHIADIPIIDLSVLHKGNASQAELDEVVKQVRFACENIGFFQIVNHGVSLELQRAVFQASRKFFELPMSEKMAMKRDPYGNRGYEILGGQVLEGAVEGTHMKMQSGYSGMDLKEVHYIGKERAPGDPMLKKRFNGLNKLPPAVPEFPMVMAEYYDTMYDLAVKVMEVIALYSLLQEGKGTLILELWDWTSPTSWTPDSVSRASRPSAFSAILLNKAGRQESAPAPIPILERSHC